jgi:N-acetylmuramoyl-L-alanine amidase
MWVQRVRCLAVVLVVLWAGGVAARPAHRAAGRPVAAPGGGPQGTTLDELRFRSYPSFTRIVLETSAAVAYRVEQTGPKEARIRVSGLSAAARTEEVADGFVNAIRLERVGADALVRVLYEDVSGTLRILTLADPPRLVLDVQRPAEAVPRENRVEITPLRTIVLDAGHGGHDTGAIGPTGLMEKEVVLDVARRVARLVEDHLHLKVLLSRDSDVFVPLRDRTSFANRQRADLFVSIHANAHRERATDGVETYFLSSEATDNESRQVAAQENGVVKLEPAGRNGKTDIVRTILWDLAQSEFQVESERLAEVVHDAVTQSLRIGNRGVKQAGFYVLGGAAMPAILLEIGFVTNPREERKLRSTRYRDELARAILAGLAEYKRQWDQRLRAADDPPAARRR